MEESYTPPVSALLELGGSGDAEPSAASLGIGREHVPELMRLAADDALFREMDVEEDDVPLRAWGPVHAWRVLGELAAPEGVPVLLDALVRHHDSDWPVEVIPLALGQIGAPALEPARAVLFQDGIAGDPFVQASAGDALMEIARAHPELRDEVVAALTAKLEMYEANEAPVTSCVAVQLVGLKAAEALPLIEKAYLAGRIDPMALGDLKDIEILLGLREKRTIPRPSPLRVLRDPEPDPSLFASLTKDETRALAKAVARAKAKKKAEKQGRKNSRKKRKK